ncbi:MAG: YitT family protein, partial [Peptostreptococcales bacterium]
MKKKLRVVLWEYLQLTLGPAIVAIGLVAFLEPYTIAPGGVTGIAILIKKTTGFPMDITNIVINGPLFIAGLILLGKRFGIKTGYATLALSVFIRIFTQFISMDVLLLEDVLLAAIYGGAFVGI